MKDADIVVGAVYLVELFGRIRRCRVLNQQKMPSGITQSYWKVMELHTRTTAIVHPRDIKEYCSDVAHLRVAGLEEYRKLRNKPDNEGDT